MSRPKILITNPSIPKSILDMLRKKCQLIINDEQPVPSRSQILSRVHGVDAIFWRTRERLDKEVLDAAGPQVKIVATMSAGINHIDLEELKKRGIKLANTPKVVDNSVANIAVLLALAASRRLHESRLMITQNKWTFDEHFMIGEDIEGSTVGIVGLGGIGQAIMRRLKPFEVSQFLYSGHTEKTIGKELGAKFVPFDFLIKESDFVIVACPLTDETRNLFSKDVFSKMKHTAVFVNVARGEVVVQDDLIQALKTGDIFAAGLDVTNPEPLPHDHQLLSLPNCVVTPHLGTATYRVRTAMAKLTAENILRALDGQEMLTPVLL